MSEAGPMALYRRQVAEGALDADPAQRLAVEKLQLLAMRLADYDPAKPKRVGLGRFGWGRDRLEDKPVPGLYLYGGVGRGKSMLMDLFSVTAPVAKKRRVHFHAFMQEVHRGHRPGAGARRQRSGPPGRRRHRRRGDASLLRRDADQRHHRRHAGRPPLRAAVRARRRGRDHLEPRPRRALQGRTEPPALPALHRADQGAARGARARQRDRPPPRPPGRCASLSQPPRPGGHRGAGRRLGRARPRSGRAPHADGAGQGGDAPRLPQRRGAGHVRRPLRRAARSGRLSRDRRGDRRADPR